MNRTLFGLVFIYSAACKIMLDGGRPNIIPLPADSSHVGDRPNTADDGTINADFAEPWNSITLPYGNGDVVAADEHHIEMSYDNNKLEGTATSYDSYMLVGGWTRTAHTQTDNTRAYMYSREGESAGFVVTWDGDSSLNVVVELLDGIGASKVQEAFGGDLGGAHDDGHGGGH